MADNIFELAGKHLDKAVIMSVAGNICDLSGSEERGDELYCLSPLRDDHKIGSFSINLKTGLYHDFSTGDSGNIFDLCVKCGVKNKREAAVMVLTYAGVSIPEETVSVRGKKRAVYPVDCDKLKKGVRDLSNTDWYKEKYGTPVKAWIWKDKNGDCIFATVRFEKDMSKDIIPISYYDDGKFHAGLPKKNHMPLYNLPEILAHPNKPVLITEGEKCSDVSVPGYVSTTWQGGSKRVKNTDWTPLKNREVLIWPDNDEPGVKAAKEIRELIGGLILLPSEDLPKGWDIADCDDPLEFIRTADYLEADEDPVVPEVEADKIPFEVLGMADSKYAFFIGREGHFISLSIQDISKTKLLSLARLAWWTARYGYDNKLTSDGLSVAYDDVIEMSMCNDFHPENLLGRGAWRNDETGEIVYHDGRVTTGTPDPGKIYLRKPAVDIGISETGRPPAKRMLQAAGGLSFKTPSDAIRTLMWATLAPFCGALEWRPAAILTGPTSTGKSSISELIIEPLSMAQSYNTGTTEAGIRQSIVNDATGIIVEELENDSVKANQVREDIFTLMRGSTTNNAPVTVKGSANQTAITYRMRCMFFFISIAPEIKNIADKNRLMFIETRRPDRGGKSWSEIKAGLREYFTPHNCRLIRAKTWRSLPQIIETARTVADRVCELTEQNHRYGIQIGYILSALMIVYLDIEKPTIEQIDEVIQEYEIKNPHDDEDSVDDAENVINSILAKKIRVELSSHETKSVTVWEAARIVGMIDIDTTDPDSFDSVPFRKELNRYGLSVVDNLFAVAVNHPMVIREFGLIKGYGKRISRHQDCKDNRSVSFLGKTYHAYLFDVLEDIPI